MRHAYLIIAHNEFDILRRLVAGLDDARNDIYIHFDKKVRDVPAITAEYSRVHVLEDRIDVRWGTVRQIRVELALLGCALKNGPYDFYHIISGTHLPLKTQDEIHGFFDGRSGSVIARVWDPDPGDADFKMRRFHFWISRFQGPGAIAEWVCQHFWTLNMAVQKALGIRHMKDVEFIKTDNWIVLPEAAARYLSDNGPRILRKYRHSFCGDEYFAATELDGRFPILNCPELLYVEFDGANPRTLPLAELDRLKATGYLFARKFTSDEK